MVDDHGCLRHANVAAREILARGDTRVERNGLLGCRSSRGDVQLAIALRQLALAGDSYIPAGSVSDTAFLRIGRQTGVGIGLYLYAIRPQATLSSFGGQLLAMGLIHDPTARPELGSLRGRREF